MQRPIVAKLGLLALLFSYPACHAFKLGRDNHRSHNLPAEMPEPLRKDIVALMRERFPDEVLTRVQAETAGFSATVLHLESNRSSYIGRFLAGRDRQEVFRDIRLSEQASQLHISPRVFYSNVDSGILVMERIEHQDILQAVVTDPRAPQRLADLLRRLHAVAPDKRFESKNLFTMIDLYRGSINRPLGREVSQLIRSMPKIRRDLAHRAQSGFIHGDLSPFNILSDGKRYWLIDWETAGVGDPLFDVATVASIILLKNTQRETFLRHYFQEDPTEEQVRLVRLQSIVCYVNYGLFLLAKAKDWSLENFAKQGKNLPNLQAAMFTHLRSLDRDESRVILGKVLLREALRLLRDSERTEALQKKF